MYNNISTLTASSLVRLSLVHSDDHLVFERPPPGLAQGSYVWPAWAVLVLALSLVSLAFLFWAIPLARKRRQRRSPGNENSKRLSPRSR